MKRTVAVLTVLLVSVLSPVTAGAATTGQQAYAGSHTTFETEQNAVVDYRVDGTRTFESVRVQSQSEANSSIGLGGSADLGGVADMVGAALSLDATTEASARVTADSGATIEAHDNGHGTLVVGAADESQYVALNVSGDGEVERESERRVVFTTGNGTEATAMVVGEGNVSVAGTGNLTAALESDSHLVVRTYGEGRSAADTAQERMIVNETAAASVYLMEQNGEAVTDTVTYGQDTTVAVSERAEGRVNMTVSRTASEGRVVVTHVADETFESADEVQVAVDGEAAASASSYAELRRATDGGATSKYVVRETGSASGSASADAQVLVGINHFSTRTVSMTDAADDGSSVGTDGDRSDGDSSTDGSSDGDSSTGDSSDGDESSNGDANPDDSSDDASDGDSSAGESGETVADTATGNGPGFGVVVALLALAAAAGLVTKRRA